MPNRPDKRDYITLASSLLQFHPEPVNGVFADDVDKKAYPSVSAIFARTPDRAATKVSTFLRIGIIASDQVRWGPGGRI